MNMTIHAFTRAVASLLGLASFCAGAEVMEPTSDVSGALATAAISSLGAYNADPAQVSVSGFSSGAFMAQQLGVAYSSRFMGVGVFAGGNYDCWRSGPPGCAYPNTPNIGPPIANMNKWSGTLIDPVSNIANQKIYVFIGTNDTVVGPNTADQVVNLYKAFTPSSNIRYDNTNPATHAFPTNIDGPGIHPCGGNGVTNCGFDGAGAVLMDLRAAQPSQQRHPKRQPDPVRSGRLRDPRQRDGFGRLGLCAGELCQRSALQAARCAARLQPELLAGRFVLYRELRIQPVGRYQQHHCAVSAKLA